MVWPLWELLLHNVLIRLSGEKKKESRQNRIFIYFFVVVVEAELLHCQCEGQWLIPDWFLTALGKSGRRKKKGGEDERVNVESGLCGINL